MTLSKTGILTGVLLFYAILSVMIGLYTQSTYIQIDDTSVNANTGAINFLPAIITGYAQLPTALNVILFGTLLTIVSWIVITSIIPTANGGS